MDDHVYLCVADSLLRDYCGDETDALKAASVRGASVEDFAKLPFCLLNNRMGEMVRDCFDEARITPRPYITSTCTQLSVTVCFERLAAAFIPRASSRARVSTPSVRSRRTRTIRC